MTPAEPSAAFMTSTYGALVEEKWSGFWAL
jgi:hypothetical protein